ncbi:MAG: molybdopterin-guanine dinucleotide biosynthesis protein B [Gammaproteobacteria bacterium]|nr:molybdopterin-guanine dinucleotide biosynthesis protein B [Gammaproteobacteria bacterium]
MNIKTVPMIGFCAWSGTGKTTLLTQVLPILVSQGLKVAVIKHAHHNFDIDHPGKDSFELREAGASQMLIASRKRMALITEFDEDHAEPSLADALERLNMQELDLILVEGFKHENYQKIELHRPELKKPLMFPDDPNIIAIASDAPIIENRNILPKLNLNKPQQIAQFIIDNILKPGTTASASGTNHS